MEGLFALESFRDFGPLSLAQDRAAPPIHSVRGRGPATLRSQVRLLCPAKPGVYGMLDAAGELVYLGKAKHLRNRLLSYFRTRSRPAKSGRIVRHAKTIVWETCAHEFAALLREQELIRRWRPRWNVHGQPLRRRLAFLCLGRAPAPHAFLTRQPPADALAIFGPVSWSERSVRAVQRVNDRFLLRDCPGPQEIIFLEQGELYPLARSPGCLRAELGTCLAPCTGLCGQADYTMQVKAALRFLSGTTTELLAELEATMQAAAAAQQFERAASLRDQAADLGWLAGQLARLREAQEAMSFIYPVVGWDGGVSWYLIHGARVVAHMPAPANRDMARQAVKSLSAVFSSKKAAHLLAPYEHHDGRMIVMQWFRQFPRERGKALTPAQAHFLCEQALARLA